MAVPLAAIFTERNPETGVSERYVYVEDIETGDYERRNVRVGVSDLFFAEIQEGLDPGEIVLLEQPKEEREKDKKSTQTAQTKNGSTNAPGNVAPRPRPNT